MTRSGVVCATMVLARRRLGEALRTAAAGDAERGKPHDCKRFAQGIREGRRRGRGRRRGVRGAGRRRAGRAGRARGRRAGRHFRRAHQRRGLPHHGAAQPRRARRLLALQLHRGLHPDHALLAVAPGQAGAQPPHGEERRRLALPARRHRRAHHRRVRGVHQGRLRLRVGGGLREPHAPLPGLLQGARRLQRHPRPGGGRRARGRRHVRLPAEPHGRLLQRLRRHHGRAVRLRRGRRPHARRGAPGAAGLHRRCQDAQGRRLRRGGAQRGRQQHRPGVPLAQPQQARRRVRPPELREPRPLRVRDRPRHQGCLRAGLPRADPHQRHRGQRREPGPGQRLHHRGGERRALPPVRGGRRRLAPRAHRALRLPPLRVRRRPVLLGLRHQRQQPLGHPVRLQAPLGGPARRRALGLWPHAGGGRQDQGRRVHPRGLGHLHGSGPRPRLLREGPGRRQG